MILTATKNHLNQLKQVCKLLTNQQLIEQLPIFNGSSIGGHIRHILEFYLCLLNAEEKGIVNYDKRKRDKALETDKSKCIETIDAILESIFKNKGNYRLKLYANFSTSSNNNLHSIETTFYRELAYNLDHVVHHLAIIKIGIKSLEEPIDLDENLGVAISTIRNNKTKEVCVQ